MQKHPFSFSLFWPKHLVNEIASCLRAALLDLKLKRYLRRVARLFYLQTQTHIGRTILPGGKGCSKISGGQRGTAGASGGNQQRKT